MFRCWNCGTDYPEMLDTTVAEVRQWEKFAAQEEKRKIRAAIDRHRKNLIESSVDIDEYQQGLIDGLRIALRVIGE